MTRIPILPDVLTPNLRVVFCGTAVGRASAAAGAYYAGPGNAFWRTLHKIGLTPRELRPTEYREMPRYGIGLTDVCKVTAGSDSEVGSGRFDVERLQAKIERYAPAILAFNGKNAARAVVGHPVSYGEQAESLADARLFVLPSTSGAARGFWDIHYWSELAAQV